MGKRIVSFIVILSLCASTFVGALRLSLRSASAEYDYNGYSIEQLVQYLDDNFSNELNYVPVRNYLTNTVNIDSNVFYCLGILDDTCFSFSAYIFPNVQGEQWEHYAINGAWALYAGQHYYESQVYLSWNCHAGFGESPDLVYSSYNYGTSFNGVNLVLDDSMTHIAYCSAFPSQGSLNGDFKLYFSKDVYSNLNYEVAYSANLFAAAPEPEEVEFEVKSFWLGERQYITTVDQYLMYSMIDFNNEGQVLKSFRGLFYTDSGSVSLYLPYEDTVLIENGGAFIDGLTNVSPNGVYAWDITNLGYKVLHEMFMYYHVDGSTGDIYAGYCTNCPYNLVADEPGLNGQPDSYTNSWTIFNNYLENYNTTHVIPENLVDSIFGVNGFKIYPCDVQIPTNIVPNISVAGYHTFKYHFLPQDDIGINYDIMDVCIVPQSEAGKYGLVYFYDDTLSLPYVFVDFVDYKSILEEFDIIIVVDDDWHALEENAWWQQLLSNYIWDFADYMAVSGSSSNGISYSSDALTDNVEQGFAIITKRAIQRQQLYVFNDGISKTYKLMSDYIDKRGDWEDSFLVWTSGLFEQWQTLDGRLSGIYSLLYGLDLSTWMVDIKTKLDRLIENTSEVESSFWYLPLWNFVKQFEPVADDFVEGLQVYDDNWDNLPLLSPVPTIPLLPTVSLGGG